MQKDFLKFEYYMERSQIMYFTLKYSYPIEKFMKMLHDLPRKKEENLLNLIAFF